MQFSRVFKIRMLNITVNPILRDCPFISPVLRDHFWVPFNYLYPSTKHRPVLTTFGVTQRWSLNTGLTV